MVAELLNIPIHLALVAGLITLLAGFVKGVLGFALPMILMSGLGSIVAPDVALAALILPTVVSNLVQGLSGGLGPAIAIAREFWVYILCLLMVLGISAQFAARVPAEVFFVLIGVPITGLAVTQLVGFRLRLRQTRVVEMVVGSLAGLMSGFAGTWGPPTVMYFTAIDLEKAKSIRAQGVIYMLGAVMLLAAHLRSGVLNAQTLPLSVGALIGVLAGMMLGASVRSHLPQVTFRRAMLWVLLVAGANLIRRGVMGA